jgi:hypothetical protein
MTLRRCPTARRCSRSAERPVPLGLVLPLPPPLDQRRDASTGEPERQHDDRGRGDEQIRERHSALTSRPSAASFRGREPRTSPRAGPRGPCASDTRAQSCSSLSRVGANARARPVRSPSGRFGRLVRAWFPGADVRGRDVWPIAEVTRRARRAIQGDAWRLVVVAVGVVRHVGDPALAELGTTAALLAIQHSPAPFSVAVERRHCSATHDGLGALPASRPASRSNVRRDAAMASHGSSPGVRRP